MIAAAFRISTRQVQRACDDARGYGLAALQADPEAIASRVLEAHLKALDRLDDLASSKNDAVAVAAARATPGAASSLAVMAQNFANVFGALVTMLNFGVKKGWIDANPALAADLPKPNGDIPIKELCFLRPAEVDSLVKSALPGRYRTLDRALYTQIYMHYSPAHGDAAVIDAAYGPDQDSQPQFENGSTTPHEKGRSSLKRVAVPADDAYSSCKWATNSSDRGLS